MRGNELLDKMNLINTEYIEAADIVNKHAKSRWFKVGATAACMCLAFLGIISAFYLHNALSTDPDHDQMSEPRVIIINHADAVMDAARQYIPGYFTEALSEDEIAAILPDEITDDIICSGYAGFDQNGTLINVSINISASSEGIPVSINIANSGTSRCYELSSDLMESTINDVEYLIYQWSADKNRILLDAYTDINGYCYTFSIETTTDTLDEDKEVFFNTLEYFSRYPKGKPDLSLVTAQIIPEYFYRQMTLKEAQSDPNFGSYMLSAVPNGFIAESICRYKDQNNDYLSGLWTKGYDELCWKVSFYEDKDAVRITSVEDNQNYDLSLYPIPRAESVPDELREIVDDPIFLAEELTMDAVYARAYMTGESGDSGGWRMSFNVKHGNYIIHINSKGVDPEWIYKQIVNLCK